MEQLQKILFDHKVGLINTEEAEQQVLNLFDVSKSFASGVQVKITGCFIGHEFEIGEIVTLVERSGEQWLAQNLKGERWYIIEEEANVY